MKTGSRDNKKTVINAGRQFLTLLVVNMRQNGVSLMAFVLEGLCKRLKNTGMLGLDQCVLNAVEWVTNALAAVVTGQKSALCAQEHTRIVSIKAGSMDTIKEEEKNYAFM